MRGFGERAIIDKLGRISFDIEDPHSEKPPVRELQTFLSTSCKDDQEKLEQEAEDDEDDEEDQDSIIERASNEQSPMRRSTSNEDTPAQ